MKRMVVFIFLIACGTVPLFSDTLSINQIDASSLLLSQKVDLYLSCTDRNGKTIEGLTIDNFTVSEFSEEYEEPEEREILDLVEGPNKEQGIHILLLLDNSGSMYDDMDGKTTENTEEMRITHAKDGVRSFIDNSINPGDVISLASFNTFLTFHSELIRDPSALDGLLGTIRRPDSEKAYTELYHSLADSSKKMAVHRGRKVVVVLSDGENYPYFTHSGKPHTEYGEDLRTPDEVIETYQREGITLYAVHFGINRDENLGRIAIDTGGNVYDARNRRELAEVYRDIKKKIENEYRLTYRAGMVPSELKYVRVALNGKREISATRHYYSSTIFGIPSGRYPYSLLLLVLAALVLWTLLLLIRYRKINNSPALEVLKTGFSTKVSASTIPLTGEKTVIGGGERADLTISGLPSLKQEHAVIVHDPTTNSYTLAGDASLTVNNRKLQGPKKLTDGDVLGIEGTTIVFDSGREKTKNKKKP